MVFAIVRLWGREGDVKVSKIIVAAILVWGENLSLGTGLWPDRSGSDPVATVRPWPADGQEPQLRTRPALRPPVLLGDFPEYRPGARDAGLESFRR
jgi:hypothetical protein